MPDVSKLIAELDWISEQISKRVWVISVAVLAFGLSFIIESIGKDAEDAFLAPIKVVGPVITVVLSMFFDLFQYVSGYRLNLQMLKHAEKSKLQSVSYDHSHRMFRLRVFSYNAKVFLCAVGVLWLVVVVIARTLELIQ